MNMNMNSMRPQAMTAQNSRCFWEFRVFHHPRSRCSPFLGTRNIVEGATRGEQASAIAQVSVQNETELPVLEWRQARVILPVVQAAADSRRIESAVHHADA